MKTIINIAFWYESRCATSFIKTCELPSIPSPGITILDWTNGEDEVSIKLDNPNEDHILYELSENTCYIDKNTYLQTLPEVYRQIQSCLRCGWEMEEPHCFEKFLLQFPDTENHLTR